MKTDCLTQPQFLEKRCLTQRTCLAGHGILKHSEGPDHRTGDVTTVQLIRPFQAMFVILGPKYI